MIIVDDGLRLERESRGGGIKDYYYLSFFLFFFFLERLFDVVTCSLFFI